MLDFHQQDDFNPRTPVGCDTLLHNNAAAIGIFQSTHPSGVRLDTNLYKINTNAFQSTHPSGVRRVKPVRSISHTPYFNPRTPVGCDTPNDAAHTVIVQFQSTHPSGVRPADCGLGGGNRLISIHAPQWGATWMRLAGRCSPGFQSTHPSGVRPQRPSRSWRFRRNFNPRTPVGCDPVAVAHLDVTAVISIHAPQWGATRRHCFLTPRRTYFNPRTPVGCDSGTLRSQQDPR